jgi:hypothetical protein
MLTMAISVTVLKRKNTCIIRDLSPLKAEPTLIATVIPNYLTTVGDPPRWPRDTPLSTKVDTKFRRQVAVDQSV